MTECSFLAISGNTLFESCEDSPPYPIAKT
jgi:hypothetical protein